MKRSRFRAKLAEYDSSFAAGDDRHFFINFFAIQNDQEVDVIQYVYDLHLTNNIMETHKVITWGLNDNGKLGHKEMLNENTEEPDSKYRKPQVVNIPHAVKKVSCGSNFTIALDINGKVWSWGMGSSGSLGTGFLGDVWDPKPIDEEIFRHGVIDIAAGAEHCLALNRRHDIFSWGNGNMGKLGHGSQEIYLLPTRIEFFKEQKLKIIALSAGEMHSACISSKYEVYTWGCWESFRLGHGSKNNELRPKLVLSIAEDYIERISCGSSHTLCLNKDGFLYAWGCGTNGRLGVDLVSEEDFVLPARVGLTNLELKKTTFSEVCAGPFQTFALTRTGELYSWGSSKFRTLGFADVKKDVLFPEPIHLQNVRFHHVPKDEEDKEEDTDQTQGRGNKRQFSEVSLYKDEKDKFTVSEVFCGETNTIFLMRSGHIFITGSGQHGQLCIDPDMENKEHYMKRMSDGKDDNLFWEDHLFFSYSPIFPPIKADIIFKHIAIGLHHIIGISKTGQAYGWGRNSEGQIGIGSQAKYIHQPVLIEEISSKDIKMAVASHTYSAFLTKTGVVYVCGTAEYGCLGVSEIKQNYDVLIPKMINDLQNVTFLAGGPQHMIAISEGDKIYAWGNTNNGRVGIAGKNEKALLPRPVKIPTADKMLKFEKVTPLSSFTNVIGFLWFTPYATVRL